MPFMMLILGSFLFVESWLLIKYATCPLIFNWDDTILSRRYFESWFDNSYCCLLFTISSVSEKSTIILYVTVPFLIQGIWQGKFFLDINFKQYFCVQQNVTYNKSVGEFKFHSSEVEYCHSQSCHQWSICHIQLGCGCLYRCFEITINVLVCGVPD